MCREHVFSFWKSGDPAFAHVTPSTQMRSKCFISNHQQPTFPLRTTTASEINKWGFSGKGRCQDRITRSHTPPAQAYWQIFPRCGEVINSAFLFKETRWTGDKFENANTCVLSLLVCSAIVALCVCLPTTTCIHGLMLFMFLDKKYLKTCH